ncbi:MAG: hypothetical protein WCJ66_04310 [Verrucomicrobiota bacterium]
MKTVLRKVVITLSLVGFFMGIVTPAHAGRVVTGGSGGTPKDLVSSP